jgi:hypothetical protein
VLELNRDKLSSDSHRASDPDDEIQWAPVATAPDQLTAEMWQQLMRQEAIPSMLAPQDTMSFLGVTANPVRLMVPQTMLARAEALLADILGGASTPEAGES